MQVIKPHRDKQGQFVALEKTYEELYNLPYCNR